MPAYHVYVLGCADGTLYTGIARDVAARLAEHQAGRGARYTRGRGPLKLLGSCRCASQGNALQLEWALKQLTRTAKLALLATPDGLAHFGRRLRARLARAKRDSPRRSLRAPRRSG